MGLARQYMHVNVVLLVSHFSQDTRFHGKTFRFNYPIIEAWKDGSSIYIQNM